MEKLAFGLQFFFVSKFFAHLRIHSPFFYKSRVQKSCQIDIICNYGEFPKKFP